MQFLAEEDTKLYHITLPSHLSLPYILAKVGVISHHWVLSIRFSGSEKKIYTLNGCFLCQNHYIQ